MAMIVIRDSFFVIREGGAPGAPFYIGNLKMQESLYVWRGIIRNKINLIELDCGI